MVDSSVFDRLAQKFSKYAEQDNLDATSSADVRQIAESAGRALFDQIQHFEEMPEWFKKQPTEKGAMDDENGNMIEVEWLHWDTYWSYAVQWFKQTQMSSGITVSVSLPEKYPKGMGTLGLPIDYCFQGEATKCWHKIAQASVDDCRFLSSDIIADKPRIIGKSRQPRRSREKPDNQMLLVSVLMKHHNYGTNEPNYEPATQEKLARILGWDRSKVSRVMKKIFGKNPMSGYKRTCTKETIIGFLRKRDDETLEVDASMPDR